MNDQTNVNEPMDVQDKRALELNREHTIEGNFYVPPTDIFETPEALTVVMEVPGVERESIDIELLNNQLTVTARIGLERYGNLRPIHTEYEIGHFTRSFQLSNAVDQCRIEANVSDGVLLLKLPKVEEAAPRRIAVK